MQIIIEINVDNKTKVLVERTLTNLADIGHTLSGRERSQIIDLIRYHGVIDILDDEELEEP